MMNELDQPDIWLQSLRVDHGQNSVGTPTSTSSSASAGDEAQRPTATTSTLLFTTPRNSATREARPQHARVCGPLRLAAGCAQCSLIVACIVGSCCNGQVAREVGSERTVRPGRRVRRITQCVWCSLLSPTTVSTRLGLDRT